jgi:ribosomal protein S18 acetylase RimI-like enzyme
MRLSQAAILQRMATDDHHVEVRRITERDGPLLRRIRLDALRTDPSAFGSTYADQAAFPARRWQAMAAESARGEDMCLLLAFRGPEAAGMVRAVRDPGRPEVFGVYSVWVAPAARRLGVGRALLDAVEEWVRGAGGLLLELTVMEDGEDAQAFYAAQGYQFDGRRERPVGARAVELGMSKALPG